METKDSKAPVCLVWEVTGRVQGVGFRFTAQALAASFDLTGFVRNEWDGSVHMEVEGARSEVENFVAEVYRSRLGHYIQQDNRTWRKASGSFDRFEIRY